MRRANQKSIYNLLMPPTEWVPPPASESPVAKCSARRMAKKKRKLVEAGKGDKNTYFDVYGAEARAELIFQPVDPNRKLELEDLQGLVKWVLAEGTMPHWIFIKNKPLVSKVVMVYLAGLDAALYMSHLTLLQNTSTSLGNPLAVMALSPSADAKQTINALLTCRVKRKRKEQLEKITSSSEVHTSQVNTSEGSNNTLSKAGTAQACQTGVKELLNLVAPDAVPRPLSTSRKPPLPASHYTLTEKQMMDHLYPGAGPTRDLLPGYVVTQSSSAAPNIGMVAVDCEMCVTEEGLELTRVSLVDEHGKVLLDKMVKPARPITNYNTQWSGITPEMLEGVTTSLADVQEEFLKLVKAETILIGHSLESDLGALKVVHKRVIDTAILYPHPRGSLYKSALRTLAAKFLKRKIQNGSSGHNSIEDAQAAMDLVLLKLQNGARFGEPLDAMSRESLISILSKQNRQCSLIDRPEVVQRYAIDSCHAIGCVSDEEVLSRVEKEVNKKTVDFVWARLSDLNTFYEERARDPEKVAALAAEHAAFMTCREGTADHSHPPISEELKAELCKLDRRVKRVHGALPVNTMMIVVTGHGDTAGTRRLQQLKWMKAAPDGAESWQHSADSLLEDFQARSAVGLGFFCIKTEAPNSEGHS